MFSLFADRQVPIQYRPLDCENSSKAVGLKVLAIQPTAPTGLEMAAAGIL
jgi:hypothetical protein